MMNKTVYFLVGRDKLNDNSTVRYLIREQFKDDISSLVTSKHQLETNLAYDVAYPIAKMIGRKKLSKNWNWSFCPYLVGPYNTVEENYK